MDNDEWLDSPMGRATTAKEEGHPFLELDLELSHSRREVTFFGTEIDGGSTRASTGILLGAVESLGWKLEHAGYYFLPLAETSRERILGTSQRAAVSGQTRGVYLFRNVDG